MPPPTFAGLHHVQLAIPVGSEQTARDFYVGVLGMEELEKPSVLAARGGCWFRAGGWEIHLGVETPFTPARKAHPGVLVRDIDGLGEQLCAAGVGRGVGRQLPGTPSVLRQRPVWQPAGVPRAGGQVGAVRSRAQP